MKAEINADAWATLNSDTFTDSLARLTGDEQKAAKTVAFDLQLNRATPGLGFHQRDKASATAAALEVSSTFRSMGVRGDCSRLGSLNRRRT